MHINRRSILCAAIAGSGGVAGAEPGANVRHHGVLVRVPDLDAASAFYCEGLGFPMADFRPRAGWMRLASNLPIYIEVSSSARLHGPEIACAEITFQSNDLEQTIPIIRASRGRITTDAPYDVAVGRAIRFTDTAGIVHHLLQPTGPSPRFAEPSVYNCGLDLPVAAIAPARVLIEQGLGFPPLTERYFPPSIPYLEADRTFAFMVHHHQPGMADLLPRPDPRNDDLGAWQVFIATDLAEASRRAIASGAISLDTRPRRFAMGRRLAFTTPGGGPFEIWSWA